jgi:hypothetical protein
MSDRVHVLAQQLFGKSTVAECDLQEVKSLALRYPYFAPAQFLLLEKLKQENSSEYQAQLQKAVLYYHNPVEFEYFIASDKFYTEVDFDDISETETISAAQPVTEINNEASIQESIVESVPGDTYEDIEIAEEITEQSAMTEIHKESDPSETSEEVSLHHKVEDHPVQQVHEMSVENDQPEISSPANDETTSDQNQTQSDQPDVEAQTAPVTEASAQLNQAPSPAGPTNGSKIENDLAFEPFHTVDYFASQGIKLSQEEAGKDKFGKQLKSFTEWLKTMKRLPATQLSKEATPTEQKVQHMAADSVHEADVVTEAMAEVWLKQGNREKAIETYNKLGLLNPSKKPYFAALIENLKRS